MANKNMKNHEQVWYFMMESYRTTCMKKLCENAATLNAMGVHIGYRIIIHWFIPAPFRATASRTAAKIAYVCIHIVIVMLSLSIFTRSFIWFCVGSLLQQKSMHRPMWQTMLDNI